MSYKSPIELNGVGKCYEIYRKPSDRLWQIIFRGKRKFHSEFWALKGIDLRVEKGETVGIIGRNGSGKSTLLQIICGTLNPSAGHLNVNGRVAALLELGAGFNPEFSGKENVYMAASLYGLSKGEIDFRFESIKKFAEIGDYIDQPVKTYSSGMYVRLAFAVIAHVDAEILIIDEALAVGDAFFTQKCMRYLREFQKNGTLLFVSHDLGSVKSMCERAVWLDGGVIKLEGNAKEVSEAYLAEVYTQEMSSIEEYDDNDAEKQIDQMDVNKSNSYDANSFGIGGAELLKVGLKNKYGEQIKSFSGGEVTLLDVEVIAKKHITSPIVGFFIKDRLGQHLFGDNTYTKCTESISIKSGKVFSANFEFEMPILPPGDYSVAVSVAEGTQISNVQHQWIHDAYIFRSNVVDDKYGAVGIKVRKNLKV